MKVSLDNPGKVFITATDDEDDNMIILFERQQFSIEIVIHRQEAAQFASLLEECAMKCGFGRIDF
jgi:hypothetical protein